MQQPKKLNTFIIPCIRNDLIQRCVKTIYEHTAPGTFYVYIIDQSIEGIDAEFLRYWYKNLMVIRSPRTDVHYTGNLGFSLATNLGVKLVETPYFTMLNDDVEMINAQYWNGVMDTFKMIEKATPSSPAIMVNLASIRLADWSVGRPAGEDFDILPYKKEYTDEDWDFLVNQPHFINEHLTIRPGSVFDGVTLYASVIDTQKYQEIGGTDDRYYVGAGEDYDASCKARMYGYRSVNTTLSWCFHHWSSSFKDVRDKEEIKATIVPELVWNHNHEKWGERFNIWGIQCRECKKNGKDNPLQVHKDDTSVASCPLHPSETYSMPEDTFIPL